MMVLKPQASTSASIEHQQSSPGGRPSSNDLMT